MKRIILLFVLLAMMFSCSGMENTGNVPTPESFFGFKLGTDRELAHPDEMIAYFQELDKASDRMIFSEVGRTTDDHPFVMAVISSAENIRSLEKYKEINAKLADPRMITDAQAEELIAQGKTIVGINAGIHSTEVGPVQASNMLAYKLLSENTKQIIDILENVILILTPIHNPDGSYLIVDWWRKYVGTEYEGSSLPYLYHRYVGHDNNRDWYMFTQKETQHTIKNLYEVWHPQIVLDMHQMGSTRGRLFVPPFTDPYEPNIDPILTANVNMLGTYMQNRLVAQGFEGVVGHAQYDAWTPGRAFQHYHGAVRMLTETASVRIAGPINVAPEVLEENGYLDRKVFFPLPWKGGAWTLKDIVDINVAASLSLLENAAHSREVWLSNFYQVGKNAVADKEGLYAAVIPADQTDQYSTNWLLDVLETGMVEIEKAAAPFTADGVEYSAGSAIIKMNQPYYSFAKTLLEPQVYPELRQFPGGPLKRPYDLVANTLPLMMGVNAKFISEPFEVETVEAVGVNPPTMTEEVSADGYIISHVNNGMFIAVNRLLAAGHEVYWSNEAFTQDGTEYPAGTVIAFDKADDTAKVKALAAELNFDLVARKATGSMNGYKLNPVKLGLYKSYYGNSNEGWTRWVMEKFEFDMESAFNEEIKAGALGEKYNSILLANERETRLVDGRTENTPPEYQGGISSTGVNNLKEFVRGGGTLITYGASNDFVIKQFNLGVTNVYSSMPEAQRREIAIPGSILKTTNNVNNPIAYGLPIDGNVFYRNGSFFNVRRGKVVSRYPNTEDLLLSGWLEGAKHLKGKANLVEVPYGNGKVVLIGFDPIYRAQTQATFKYVFNAMYYGAAELTAIPSGN